MLEHAHSERSQITDFLISNLNQIDMVGVATAASNPLNSRDLYIYPMLSLHALTFLILFQTFPTASQIVPCPQYEILTLCQ